MADEKIKVGIITVSDKGSAGEREDKSGQLIAEMLRSLPVCVVSYKILPDEKDLIQDELLRLADDLQLDLILTTGGTGLSPRDVTPEATAGILHKQIPGVAEAIRWQSLQKTPYAMLSRAVCGIRGRSFILNLPGSPKAVAECLEVVMPVLPHAINKLRGDTSECAR